MKAVILAGGKGTRGKPYTDYFPKAMTPVEGKPLIDYIIKYIEKFDFIKEIIIITDLVGLGGQIKNYYQNYDGKKLSFIQDAQNGTGGDLLCLKSKLGNDKNFLLWFVDNLCAIDLNEMKNRFQIKKSAACIATRTNRREETGFAIIKDGIIEKFMEKPIIKLQMAECLGIYILGSEILDIIKSKKKHNINLSYDILEPLSKEGKISSFDIEKDWIDVESPVLIQRNQDVIKSIIKEMEC